MLPTRLGRYVALTVPLIACVTFAVGLNLWAMHHPARFDVTTGGVYSMSPATRNVIARLEVPVEIAFFYDLRNRGMLDAKALLEQYAAASPRITLRAYDPVLRPAAAERYQVRFAGTAIFTTAVRRVVVDTPGEAGFTNGLIRVSNPTIGRICFTDGHIESNPFSLSTHDHFESDMAGGGGHNHGTGGRPLTIHERHGLGMAKNALETEGYRVEQRLLLKSPGALADCTVLVVASPQTGFQQREIVQIDTFLEQGGHALFMVEPGIETGLEPVLAKFGIDIGRAMVRDPDRHYWTDPATPAVSDYGRHRITRNLPLSFFPGVAELTPAAGGVPEDIVIEPLVESSASSVLAGGAPGAPRQRTLMLEAVRAGPAKSGDTDIVVAGDGDFATNSFFGALGNGQLFLNAVSHLAERGRLLDIEPRHYTLARTQMTNTQLRATFLLTTVIGPLILALTGLWVWLTRR